MTIAQLARITCAPTGTTAAVPPSMNNSSLLTLSDASLSTITGGTNLPSRPAERPLIGTRRLPELGTALPESRCRCGHRGSCGH